MKNYLLQDLEKIAPFEGIIKTPETDFNLNHTPVNMSVEVVKAKRTGKRGRPRKDKEIITIEYKQRK